jgi:hypothetical protein
MPQLVYSAEGAQESGQPARWNEAVRDAGGLVWQPALRTALMLGIPAGVLCSFLGLSGLLLMVVTGAWVVTLYMRSQRPAWITIGAGARLGLVTGLLAGWLAFASNGGQLFAQRYFLHQSSEIDKQWKELVNQNMETTQRISAMIGPADPAQAQTVSVQTQDWMLSPEGQAGMMTVSFAWVSFLLVLFSTAGGALGARLQARQRRPKI